MLAAEELAALQARVMRVWAAVLGLAAEPVVAVLYRILKLLLPPAD